MYIYPEYLSRLEAQPKQLTLLFLQRYLKFFTGTSVHFIDHGLFTNLYQEQYELNLKFPR